jgi:hypothetical protein
MESLKKTVVNKILDKESIKLDIPFKLRPFSPTSPSTVEAGIYTAVYDFRCPDNASPSIFRR